MKMKKNNLTTRLLLGIALLGIAIGSTHAGDAIDSLKKPAKTTGSVKVTAKSMNLGTFGYVLNPNPTLEYVGSISHGNNYAFADIDTKLKTGEPYGLLMGAGRTFERGKLSGLVEAELFSVKGFDTWLEGFGTVAYDLGRGFSANATVSMAAREPAGIFTGAGLSYSKQIGKWSFGIQNLTGRMTGNYFGVEDSLGANTTKATATYQFRKNMSAFGTVHHNQPLTKQLEQNTAIEAGFKVVF
ncbi:MAG: hypothetical protein ACI8Y7_000200 [Candidatus Woesearchaeota archaeon]|jgi:hypothetical protein